MVRDWDQTEREHRRKEAEKKRRGEKGSSPRHHKPDEPACGETASNQLIVMAALTGLVAAALKGLFSGR